MGRQGRDCKRFAHSGIHRMHVVPVVGWEESLYLLRNSLSLLRKEMCGNHRRRVSSLKRSGGWADGSRWQQTAHPRMHVTVHVKCREKFPHPLYGANGFLCCSPWQQKHEEVQPLFSPPAHAHRNFFARGDERLLPASGIAWKHSLLGLFFVACDSKSKALPRAPCASSFGDSHLHSDE